MHIASTLDFDAAILDLNLAGELSFPVADVLRARDIPFDFATGYGRAGIPDSYKDFPVIAKTFRPGAARIGSPRHIPGGRELGKRRAPTSASGLLIGDHLGHALPHRG